MAVKSIKSFYNGRRGKEVSKDGETGQCNRVIQLLTVRHELHVPNVDKDFESTPVFWLMSIPIIEKNDRHGSRISEVCLTARRINKTYTCSSIAAAATTHLPNHPLNPVHTVQDLAQHTPFKAL